MSVTAPNASLFNPQSLSPPESLHPAQVRVVELQSETRTTTLRMDCYELESEEKMFRLVGDEVQVCAIDWARTDEATDVDVCWTSTGLSYWEVDQIRVFSWPDQTLIRVYRDVE